MKIDWKQKLSSRKLWCAVAAWVTSLLTAFNVSENIIAQTGIIIAGIGSLCVYILAESHVDAGNTEFEVTHDIEISDNE
jgi:hypothetical protein